MILITRVLLAFWLINSGQVLCEVSKQRVKLLSKLATDLIENERVASILWASICCSKSDEVNFLRGSSIPVQMVETFSQINAKTGDNTNKQWFLVDMKCEKSRNFLTSVDEKYFAHPYRWIIIDATNDSIGNLTLLADSNIILIGQEKDSTQLVLSQIYKIAQQSSLIHEEYGFWSYENGLIDLRKTRILSRRRRNLRGHQLTAATVFIVQGSENRTDLDDYNHNKVDMGSKVCLLITQHWVDSVNATMHVDIHRTWGYKDLKTGQTTGMAGQLERREADIGGTVIFITKDRIDTLEYLSMALPTKFAFILRSPPISYVSNIYYLPFDWVVWICSISLVVLCTLVIAFILRLHLIRYGDADILTSSDYFLFAVASSCQMGSSILSKVLSARISMFFFFVALLFIYTSFTANIVALLQSTTKSIREISHLQNPLIGIEKFMKSNLATHLW